ncbi:hypothetical protein [Chitinilyticum aquatile]|uniref:hypothetical protein n=1 Tax=Chitinilyticum aquatile TaxID=362520 RepID=UPI0012DE91E5|nr:hypothetical protein [Chitinilyticum aquatile]
MFASQGGASIMPALAAVDLDVNDIHSTQGQMLTVEGRMHAMNKYMAVYVVGDLLNLDLRFFLTTHSLGGRRAAVRRLDCALSDTG